MSRRLAVVAATAAVAAAAGGFAVVWFAGSRDDVRRERPRLSAQAAQGQAVAKALRGLARDPAALVADASRRLVGGQARRAVARGARVNPHQQSWRPDGYGGGVMTVTITPPNGTSVRYAAVMVQQPTGWKVLATVPVQRGPRTP